MKLFKYNESENRKMFTQLDLIVNGIREEIEILRSFKVQKTTIIELN